MLWTAFLPLGFSALLTLHEQPSLTLVERRTGEGDCRFSATPLDYLHVSPEHALPLPRSEHAPEERSLYPD